VRRTFMPAGTGGIVLVVGVRVLAVAGASYLSSVLPVSNDVTSLAIVIVGVAACVVGAPG
jgi:hypothetical protein